MENFEHLISPGNEQIGSVIGMLMQHNLHDTQSFPALKKNIFAFDSQTISHIFHDLSCFSQRYLTKKSCTHFFNHE